MLVIRGTKKLRDRLKGPLANADDTSSTALGDWFANAVFWKPHVALLVNQRTLLPVFMPLAPAATLTDRIPEAIASVLRRHGAAEEFIAHELAAMADVRIAPTNDRSTVGVMTEFAYHGGGLLGTGISDLETLSYELSSMILGPLLHRHGSAKDELASVLHGGAAASVPRSATAGKSRGEVLQLKVTLRDVKPPVWRRLLVDASTPLDRLHEYIQAAFGWWNYHVYEFEIDDTSYGIPDPDWDFDPPVKRASRTKLVNVAGVGDSFVYTYDFGDGWEHDITIEKALPPDVTVPVPSCTDGRRACPPEDCGGPWGYAELLKILADPSHPEHDEQVRWYGDDFEPEAFDPSEFDDNLAVIRQAIPR